jgi:hypothetical protein
VNITRTPPDETIEQYHRSGAWGSTMLGHLKSSPALANLIMTGKHSPKTTPDMRVGSQFHALMEDRDFKTRYRLGPDVGKRTKAWEKAEQDAALESVELIHPDDWATIHGMRDSVYANAAARFLIVGAEREIGFRGSDPETGVTIQCRADLLPANSIVDYKTTKSLDTFARSVAGFGYHRQAALYRHLVRLGTGEKEPRPFYFIAVEKSPPLYRCRVFSLTAAFYQAGADEVSALLREVRDRTDTHHWADDQHVIDLAPPPWLSTAAPASDFEEEAA